MAKTLRCDVDPKEFIVWKNPTNTAEYGSQIIVQESQLGLLLSSGQLVGTLEPGSYPIESANIPLLKRLLPGGESSIPYDIWFATCINSNEYKWGTRNPIQVFDSKYNVMVPIGCFGSSRLKIRDFQSFFQQVVGTSSEYKIRDLRDFIIPFIEREIIQSIAELAENNNVFTISSSTKKLSDECGIRLKSSLKRFGIEFGELFVQGISVISDDPSFIEIKNALSKASSIEIKGGAISNNKETYSLERSFDVLENAAKNDSGTAGSFIGAGVGLGAGLNLANNMSPLQNQNSNPENSGKSVEERLKSLKSLHDQGLINNDEYNQKRSSILSEL